MIGNRRISELGYNGVRADVPLICPPLAATSTVMQGQGEDSEHHPVNKNKRFRKEKRLSLSLLLSFIERV
jgi:hypothetical protein